MGLLNENQALQKLGEDNFEYLTPNKVQLLCQMLPDMDESAVAKAVQLCPGLINAFVSMEKQQLSLDERLSDANEQSVASSKEIINKIISSIDDLSKKGTLSPEEKSIVVEGMIEIGKITRGMEKDSQIFKNKLATNQRKSKRDTLKTIASIFGGIVTIAGLFLGVKNNDRY